MGVLSNDMEGSGCNPAADKYLKKFIKKFWLKSIPELSGEDDIYSDNNNVHFDSKHYVSEKLNDHAEISKSEILTVQEINSTLNDRTEMSHNYVNNPRIINEQQRNELSSSNQSKSQSNKPFHRTHRRLPSYGNIDIIFV